MKTVVKTKHRETLSRLGQTGRKCSHEGCTNAAPFINGYYMVETRRVRVWVCREHYTGNAKLVVPTPSSVQAALDFEKEYREERARLAKYVIVGEKSIKTLAATGHGEFLPVDRIAAWRWNGF